MCDARITKKVLVSGSITNTQHLDSSIVKQSPKKKLSRALLKLQSHMKPASRTHHASSNGRNSFSHVYSDDMKSLGVDLNGKTFPEAGDSVDDMHVEVVDDHCLLDSSAKCEVHWKDLTKKHSRNTGTRAEMISTQKMKPTRRVQMFIWIKRQAMNS
jgi:hypothetical protein